MMKSKYKTIFFVTTLGFFPVPLDFYSGSDVFAANKQGGGIFAVQPKKSRKRKKSVIRKPAPVNQNQFDGRYTFKSSLIANNKSPILGLLNTVLKQCLPSGSMTVNVVNGKSSSQFTTGKRLNGYVEGNNLRFASARSASGGYWYGKVGLSTQRGAMTSGFINWESPSKSCKYTVSGKRL